MLPPQEMSSETQRSSHALQSDGHGIVLEDELLAALLLLDENALLLLLLDPRG